MDIKIAEGEREGLYIDGILAFEGDTLEIETILEEIKKSVEHGPIHEFEFEYFDAHDYTAFNKELPKEFDIEIIDVIDDVVHCE